jgi:hypothetical protein
MHVLFAVQVESAGHVPQLMVPPHPSEIVPHTCDAEQVLGTQRHWLVLVSQVVPVGHVPQFTDGQPGACWVPHCAPAEHVVGQVVTH